MKIEKFNCHVIKEYRENKDDVTKFVAPRRMVDTEDVLAWGKENAIDGFSSAYSRPKLMENYEWYYTREHIQVMIHNQE